MHVGARKGVLASSGNRSISQGQIDHLRSLQTLDARGEGDCSPSCRSFLTVTMDGDRSIGRSRPKLSRSALLQRSRRDGQPPRPAKYLALTRVSSDPVAGTHPALVPCSPTDRGKSNFVGIRLR